MAGVEKSVCATLALSGLVMLVGQVSYDHFVVGRAKQLSGPITATEYRQRRAAFLADPERAAEPEPEPELPPLRLARFTPAENLLNDSASNSPTRSLGRCGVPLAIK